jgi:pimeloyl-ACP methyl ester carboxylesterase
MEGRAGESIVVSRTAMAVRPRRVRANGVDFGLLESGDSGPLVLCLHGFPDTAHTFRHLLPELAAAGFHAVAPFMRGYAPTAVPADECYTEGALVADVVALHEVLGGDDQAVLVGHDWGAEAAYGAAAFAPQRFRRLVTIAVPPFALDPVLFSDYDQLRKFFYLYFLRDPAAEEVVAADDMSFLERLWRDWSPGHDPTEDVAFVKESLREPAHLKAAIDYYRPPSAVPSAYEAEERAARQRPEQPTLFIYGADDGCIRAELVGEAGDALAPGSRSLRIPDAGHFPHLEKPVEVNEHIVAWLTD